ncbi:MAG: SagB family peptide dehydrogenase, partial [Cyanobacteria bacterium P01_D01_bin.116]
MTQPRSVKELNIFPDLSPETIQKFVNLLWSTQFLAVEPEPLSLQVWEFHNLLFHSRSRSGRHDLKIADSEKFIENLPEFPVVKPPMSSKIVPLPRPNLQIVIQGDLTLTEAIETRKSIRDYDDEHPITLEQLSELLYRTARIKDVYRADEEFENVEYDFGELSSRPYPGGGSLYELEIYPVVHRCEGLDSGIYHYDPLNHQLEQLPDNNANSDSNLKNLIVHARNTSGEQGTPQILLVITARFGRFFWKYRSVAYAVVLKHVGVLYQNLYLVANSMGLAPCALGNGDTEYFEKATGLDYIEESSVGEFMLGSLPNPNNSVSASMTELDEGVGSGEQGAGGEKITSVILESVESNSEIEPVVMASNADIIPSTIPILHPHDLDNRIPGLINLRNHTLGDSRITIVILDSNPDQNLSCFEKANISKVFPYWNETAEPITSEAYAIYREIENSDLEGDEKREKIKAVLSEAIINRIKGDNHATHITSTIVGQENTPAPGIA